MTHDEWWEKEKPAKFKVGPTWLEYEMREISEKGWDAAIKQSAALCDQTPIRCSNDGIWRSEIKTKILEAIKHGE